MLYVLFKAVGEGPLKGALNGNPPLPRLLKMRKQALDDPRMDEDGTSGVRRGLVPTTTSVSWHDFANYFIVPRGTALRHPTSFPSAWVFYHPISLSLHRRASVSLHHVDRHNRTHKYSHPPLCPPLGQWEHRTGHSRWASKINMAFPGPLPIY